MSRSYAAKATLVGAFAFGALVATPASATAQQYLNFTGAANLYDEPGSGGANLFIDFLTGGASGGSTGTITVDGTVTVPGLAEGQTGTITDLTISPAGVVGTPINPFVQIGGYTFVLENAEPGNAFGPISLIPAGPSTIGFFGVSGTVSGGAYGTERSFIGTFTTQFAGRTPAQVFNTVNSGGTINGQSFSAEFVVADATVIPEPSTYLLVATGMAAIAMIGRRRRAQNQA